jgi:hypothetical protein
MSNFIQGYELRDLIAGATVTKAAQALPQSATATLFTVTGGAVLITGLAGLVKTALGSTATNLSIGTVPSVGTAETNGIASATAVASLAAGTWLMAPINGSSSPSQPAVPATTVTQQNTNPYTVSVAISANGATITSVNVNGTQVGTTAGTYLVPSLGTISITYTVATPTWVWSNAKTLSPAPGGGISSLGSHPTGLGALVVSAGTITWTTSASDTGTMAWYLTYVPLDNGALVS